MPIQTAVPTVAGQVARTGGVTDWSGVVANVQTVDNIYMGNVAFTNAGSVWTPALSKFILFSGFGFSFAGGDALVSISAAIVFKGAWAGVPPGLVTADVGAVADTIQLYNAGLIGSANSYSPAGPIFPDTTQTFNSWAVSPSIAVINGAGFGIVVGVAGSYLDGPTFTNANAPSLNIDQIQLTITTSNGGTGGGPNGNLPGREMGVFPQFGQFRPISG